MASTNTEKVCRKNVWLLLTKGEPEQIWNTETYIIET